MTRHVELEKAGIPAAPPAPSGERAAAQLPPGWQGKEDLTWRMLDSADVGIVFVGPDERITYANRSARRMLNVGPSEPLTIALDDFKGQTFSIDGTPLDVHDYPAIRCLRTGEPQGPTIMGLGLENGRRVWASVSAVPVVDAAGRLEGAVATFSDVTGSVHSEESLRHSEERYRRLVEQAPDAIVVHRERKIVFVNDAAVRLWAAASRDDLIGRDILDFVHPRHREVAAARIRKAQAGEVTPLAHHIHRRLDGRVVHVEVTGMPCVYDGLPSIQVIFRNVTKRVRAERQVRRQRKALQQSHAELELRVAQRTEELSRKNAELEKEVAERRRAEARLQEKQQFMERLLTEHERHRQLIAYEIHDTFLQEVIAALMFIDSSHNQNDKYGSNTQRLDRARELLRKAIDEARRMISGLRPPIIDEHGIAAAIEYLVNEMRLRGLDVEFENRLDGQRVSPAADAAIFRIVQESLTNVERHSQARYARVSLERIGDHLRLQIRDFGAGFTPEQVAEGHFGLQGIKERAGSIGARVSIHSRPGEGTEITVDIPLPRMTPAPMLVRLLEMRPKGSLRLAGPFAGLDASLERAQSVAAR